MYSIYRTMTKLTIGVAVPCYKGHIHLLPNLLASLEEQTLKPDMVIVSCSSSTSSDVSYSVSHYSFPVHIIFHKEKKCEAENRNIAGSFLMTDIITFIDADDTIHPQRLEIIEDCFQNHSVKILIHSLEQDPAKPYEHYERPFQFDMNCLYRCPWGSLRHLNHSPDMAYLYHNGMSTVTRSIFDMIQFNESPELCGRIDTLFTTTIVTMFPNEHAYCHYRLCKYMPSGTGGVDTTTSI